jgi:hypothetical protein
MSINVTFLSLFLPVWVGGIAYLYLMKWMRHRRKLETAVIPVTIPVRK